MSCLNAFPTVVLQISKEVEIPPDQTSKRKAVLT